MSNILENNNFHNYLKIYDFNGTGTKYRNCNVRIFIDNKNIYNILFYRDTGFWTYIFNKSDFYDIVNKYKIETRKNKLIKIYE